jgi:hypothetical protein
LLLHSVLDSRLPYSAFLDLIVVIETPGESPGDFWGLLGICWGLSYIVRMRIIGLQDAMSRFPY